jgi:hypothetical protein
MTMKRKFLLTAIILFWLFTMAALIDRHHTVFSGEPPGEPHALQDSLGKERWSGIYQQGRKAGYTMSRLDGREGGYKASELAFMRIKALGAEKEIRMTTNALLDNTLKLKSFTFNLESDIDMQIEGTVEGRDLLVTIDAKGIKTKQILPLKSEPYINLSLAPLLAGMELNTGKTIRLPLFDPSTLAQDHLELNIMGKEQITVMGMKQETFKLKGSFKGTEIFMWATEDGEVLREESMGFTFVMEQKEDAVKLDQVSIDLVADMAVPFNLELKPDIDYLKVRLTGTGLGGLELDGDNQNLLEDNVLEIWRAEIGKKAEINDKKESMTSYLEETLFVETKDPRIISLAKEITSKENDPFNKARLIFDWVFKKIKKTSTMSIPRSTAVLDSKEGDCNEHTTLYTALARASGIPTRMAVGMVYQEDRFYYHAWPEIYISKWIPIDPTLGQFPADATHIRLLTGGLDSQLRLAPVMGNLKIEGLEFK